MSEIIKINVKGADNIAHSFEFEKEKIIIGRDPASDLVIDDIEVSRNHIIVFKEGNIFFVEDQNSTNGSFINSKRVKQKTEIKSGDLITLGKNNVLEFLMESIDVESDSTMEASKAVAEEEALLEPEAAEPIKELDAEAIVQTAEEKEAEKPEDKTKKPTWVVILLAALAFIVIFCVIPVIVIEATNQWCDLFAGFFNSMSPGVCP